MKTKSFRLIISTTLICLAIMSCRKSDTVEPPTVEEPPDLRNAMLPLAVGNSWTYVDSLITATDTSVRYFSQSVSSYRLDNDIWWWKISNNVNDHYFELSESGDSVFTLQYNFGNPLAVLEYPPLYATDTSFWFFSIVEGDIEINKYVSRFPGHLTVPAGSFDSCVVYYFSLGERQYWDILRPGIGVVAYQFDINDSFSGYRASRRISLTSYNLN